MALQYREIDISAPTFKWAKNPSVGTSFAPITANGELNFIATATTVRVAAGNANDTAAGTGAREVTVYGTDETGALVSEAIATAGESPSGATLAKFTSIYRAKVTSVGSRATTIDAAAGAGSNAAAVVIEDSAGASNLAYIAAGESSTQHGYVMVPAGYYGRFKRVGFEVDATKITTVRAIFRRNVLASEVFQTAGAVEQWVTREWVLRNNILENSVDIALRLPPLTEFWLEAKVDTGTARVNAAFEFEFVKAGQHRRVYPR